MVGLKNLPTVQCGQKNQNAKHALILVRKQVKNNLSSFVRSYEPSQELRFDNNGTLFDGSQKERRQGN